MIKDESFEYYKAQTSWINPSSFKGADIHTPLHYLAKKESPKKETVSMKIGTALHCLILTPELFNQEYHVLSNKEFTNGRKTKNGMPSMTDPSNKKIKQALLQKYGNDKIILDPSENYLVRGMYEGIVRDNKDIHFLLDRNKGYAEMSIYMYARFTNKSKFIDFIDPAKVDLSTLSKEEKALLLPVKTRSDFFSHKKHFGLDVKTTKSAYPFEFAQDCITHGYHIQAPFTVDMLNAHYGTDRFSKFFFIAVENSFPFASLKFNCTPEFMNHGRDDYKNRLEHIHRAFMSNQWKGYEILSTHACFDEDDVQIYNRNMVDLDVPYSYISKKQYYSKHPFIKPF